MPLCSVSNTGWQTSPVLTKSETEIEFSVSKNGTMQFSLPNNQTVYLNFRFVQVKSSAINIQISIYNAKTLLVVSTLNSQTTNISSDIDLSAGDYILCIRSLVGSYKGYVKGNYIGYSRNIQLSPIIYQATTSVQCEIKTSPKKKACSKQLKWELIDGTLPIGLVLEEYNGMIHGTLPYLDCIEHEHFKNIPSSNMYRYSSGVVEPWGRRWKFKLRISVVEQPDHYDEQWFCISILNNWTRTTKKFFDIYENKITNKSFIAKQKSQYLFGLCDKNNTNKDISINNIISNEIKNWDGITEDDSVKILMLDDNEYDIQYKNSNEKRDNEYQNFKVEVTNSDNQIKTNLIHSNETLYQGLVVNKSTIGIEDDIIENINTTYENSNNGYISDDLTLSIDSYEQYQGYRQWVINEINNKNSEIVELMNNELFKDFMNNDSTVKYQYIYNENSHFIFLYREVKTLPEVLAVNKIMEKSKKNMPYEFFIGDGVELNITII